MISEYFQLEPNVLGVSVFAIDRGGKRAYRVAVRRLQTVEKFADSHRPAVRDREHVSLCDRDADVSAIARDDVAVVARSKVRPSLSRQNSRAPTISSRMTSGTMSSICVG
jgi:hypothetical protein